MQITHVGPDEERTLQQSPCCKVGASFFDSQITASGCVAHLQHIVIVVSIEIRLRRDERRGIDDGGERIPKRAYIAVYLKVKYLIIAAILES